LAHAVVYGILTLLILSGFAKKNQDGKSGFGPVLYAVSIAGGYGALMEFVQYAFIPGRFFETDDMLANFTGAILAWAASNAAQKIFKK
jgi:VanZ family protein